MAILLHRLVEMCWILVGQSSPKEVIITFRYVSLLICGNVLLEDLGQS